MKFSHFDMEQEILSCWGILDHLNTLSEGIVERGLTPDQISNILTGLHELYELKFDKLFQMYESGVNSREIT
jgi:hypothetical protein